MALKHTIRLLLNHPLNRHQRVKSIFRFVKWQLKARLNPNPMTYPFGEKSKIIVMKGLTGATGNIYAGLHEFEDMSFLLHFLRSTDFFVDIGANVGSYTILASNERGAETISIEPIPRTFQILQQNVELNDVKSLVTCMNIGAASEEDVLKFTTSLDTMNHVAKDYDINIIDVKVERLDDLISLSKPTLIKIDVEGFETKVLNGMNTTLTDTHLKAVIIELMGSGWIYGYDENKIHEKLLDFGFVPYAYNPYTRTLSILATYGDNNTIYIRDFDFVSERLTSAKSFKIRGQEI